MGMGMGIGMGIMSDAEAEGTPIDGEDMEDASRDKHGSGSGTHRSDSESGSRAGDAAATDDDNASDRGRGGAATDRDTDGDEDEDVGDSRPSSGLPSPMARAREHSRRRPPSPETASNLRTRLEIVVGDACRLLRAIGCHDLASREESRPESEWVGLLPENCAAGPAERLRAARRRRRMRGVVGVEEDWMSEDEDRTRGKVDLRASLDGWHLSGHGHGQGQGEGQGEGSRSRLEDGLTGEQGGSSRSQSMSEAMPGPGNNTVPHHAGDWPGYGVPPGDGCARILPWLNDSEAVHALDNTRGLHPQCYFDPTYWYRQLGMELGPGLETAVATARHLREQARL